MRIRAQSRGSLAARMGVQTTTGVVDGTAIVADSSTYRLVENKHGLADRRLDHRPPTKIHGASP